MSKLELISEAHDRRIIWRETGDIVHFNLKGSLLHREKYSKSSLTKIKTFLERKIDAKTQLIAQFNTASKTLLSHIKGFDLIASDEFSIEALVNNEDTAKNKIYRHTYKGAEITQMYIANTKLFEANMRYSVILNNNKVIFKKLESISSENINSQYSDEVLSIYVMDRK